MTVLISKNTEDYRLEYCYRKIEELQDNFFRLVDKLGYKVVNIPTVPSRTEIILKKKGEE